MGASRARARTFGSCSATNPIGSTPSTRSGRSRCTAARETSRLVGENALIINYDFDTDTSCDYLTEDELVGDAGNDRLYGRLGPDHLSGGSGNDYLNGGKDRVDLPQVNLCDWITAGADDNLQGGSGNDKLWAADGDRDQLIDCGTGKRDKAYIDSQDPKPKGCEKVKRYGR